MKTNDKNSKKRAAPPRYDEAFRAGAVRMVTEQGRPSKEVAQELGICIDTLRSWLKAAGVQMGQADRQNRNARRERELEAEVRALRKKLAEKDEVIEPAKKIHRHNFQTVEDKYRYVKAASKKVCVGKLCQLLEISRSGYYAWLRGGKSARKTANQALLRELVRLHEKYPALGLDSLYHMLKPVFHCSRGRVHPADEGRRHPLPTKEGLQSYHQLPPQLSHRAKPAPTPVHFQPPPTKPGWATSPTSPPGKVGCISPLSKTCAPRKLWGTPFLSALTPSLPWTP